MRMCACEGVCMRVCEGGACEGVCVCVYVRGVVCVYVRGVVCT